MDFLRLFLSPRGLLDLFKLAGKVWVSALPRMSTHVSHPWTALALKSVAGVNYLRPYSVSPGASMRIDRC